MTERIAIIDLGSNSARLIVMHIYEKGAYNLVYNQKESVRLSEGMNATLHLQPEAIGRALSTLKIFAHMCQLFQVDKIIGVATAAVRNAKNGDQFIALAEKETGILLDVISGELEAELGFIGAMNTIDLTDGLLFDLGGGSTELTLVKNRQIKQSISLPFGAVTLTERFGLQDKVNDAKIAELQAFIQAQLASLPWLKKTFAPLVGIGGTARNIAKIDQRLKNYPFAKVHNYRLGPLSFDQILELIDKTSLAQRRKLPGLSSERADIIIAGVNIVKGLLDITQAPQLVISGCGVREGLFLQYYQAKYQQPPIMKNILEHSTHNVLLAHEGDPNHAYHIASLAETLFDGWQDHLALRSGDKKLLKVAALLHDIGITINYYDHPRHSSYLIENARLFGLTHREQILAAVIAGWHNGTSAKYYRNRIYSEFLDEGDWHIARKLAMLLAIAECLDVTQMGLVKTVQALIKTKAAVLKLYLSEPAPIERQALQKCDKWIKKDLGLALEIEECFI